MKALPFELFTGKQRSQEADKTTEKKQTQTTR
jgi:hypothetical protein